LINNGASVNIANRDNEIPLQYAVQTKSHRNVWLVLGADRSRTTLTQWDSLGRTPLYIAAETGDIDIINLLLMEGANKTALDSWKGHQIGRWQEEAISKPPS
jgi:ankyrin repeat protein